MTIDNFQLTILQLLDDLFFHQVKPMELNPKSKELMKEAQWKETFTDLEPIVGRVPKFSFQEIPVLIISGKPVVVDGVLDFNRYRAKTFRSDIYENDQIELDLNKYRTWCRKMEQEALLSGSHSKAWENSISLETFGSSETSGDLGGNGSSGWKFRALEMFTLDYILLKQFGSLIHLSIYKEVMIDRRLQSLRDLIKVNQVQVVKQFLDRAVRKLLTK
jgi:hypothetical protein